MQNQNIKKRILDEMNEKKLLHGHHFLRYILFITEYKTQEQEIQENHIINDENIADENIADENITEENIADENKDNLEDTLENTLEDTLEDTLENNERELEKVRVRYNIDDIDKYKFLHDLKLTTINLSIRIYNTIKAELSELMRPHLG